MTIPLIKIEILLGDDLKEWVDEWNPGSQRLAWLIDARLRSLIDDLGIPGKPAIEIKHCPGLENLRVQARSSVLSYSLELLRKLAEYFSGRHFVLSDLTFRWGHEIVNLIDNDSFPSFLAQLVTEIIKQNPASLLGDEQVEVYLQHAEETTKDHRTAALPKPCVKNILGFLLRLNLSIKDFDRILGHIIEGRESGRSDVEISETLAARLSSNKVEIVMNHDYLKQLFEIGHDDERKAISVYGEGINDKIREFFKMMADGLFYELGIRIPDVVVTTASFDREFALSFRINNYQCPTRLGFSRDQFIVNGAKEKLRFIGVESNTSILNPANDSECCLITAGDIEKVESAGLQVWDQVGYLILALSRDLRRNAGRLLHVEKVEYELAKLHQIFPDLINAVIEKVSCTRLTRALRALLNEEISIRDLRTIFERALNCDYVVFDASKHIVFDDRLVFHIAPAGDWLDDGYALARHVRAGLKRYISNKYMRGQSTLDVYLIAPEIEQAIFDHLAFEKGDNERVGLSAEKIEQFRAAIKKEIGSLPPSAAVPAILTFSEARYFLHSLIVSEFPGLAVLAYEELSPETNIRPRARISLPEESVLSAAVH